MAKINTKSRLELAHLKRQLDGRKKSGRGSQHGEPQLPMSTPQSSTLGEKNHGKENTSFDYKFVFTNNAMKNDDRAFRMNSFFPRGQDMKLLKKLNPTNSFLPYGVTIRNPHMFEEDQLAVIQRRQEVKNVTLPPLSSLIAASKSPPMNPKINISNKNANNKNVENPGPESPTTLTKYTLSNSEKKGRLEPRPLVNYKKPADAVGVPKTGAVIPTSQQIATATQVRDSTFRQQFDASQKAIRIRDERDDSKDSPAAAAAGNYNNDAIDKLSKAVQRLNMYEDRLKRYLMSQNTMVHAGAALKQLRSKRSKTIAKLTKLTQEKSVSNQDLMDSSQSNPQISSELAAGSDFGGEHPLGDNVVLNNNKLLTSKMRNEHDNGATSSADWDDWVGSEVKIPPSETPSGSNFMNKVACLRKLQGGFGGYSKRLAHVIQTIEEADKNQGAQDSQETYSLVELGTTATEHLGPFDEKYKKKAYENLLVKTLEDVFRDDFSMNNGNDKGGAVSEDFENSFKEFERFVMRKSIANMVKHQDFDKSGLEEQIKRYLAEYKEYFAGKR